MASIGVVFFTIGLVLFVLFTLIPPDSIKLPLIDVSWLPRLLRWLIIAIIIVAVIAVVLVATFTLAFGVIHFTWILLGALLLSRSIKSTWQEMPKNSFFSQETPIWYPAVVRHRASASSDGESFSPADAQSNTSGACDDPSRHYQRAMLYRDLDRDSGDIRLLKPVRGSSGSILRFEMVQEPLVSSSGRYVALSYCNGSDLESMPIRVENQQFGVLVMVRPNVFNALTELGKLKDLRNDLIWIDALCINQDDLQELSMQVPRMRKIYAAAKTVIAWIDTPPNALPRNGSSGSHYGTLSRTATSSKDERSRNQAVASATHVLNNSYWHRLWIIQEFAVNRNLLLLMSGEVIEETALKRLLYDHGGTIDGAALEQVKNVIQIRDGWQISVEPYLIDLLMRTTASLSGRRHDRVFSVFQMAIDRERFGVEANYGINEEDFALGMTRFYLRNNPDLPLDVILLGPHFSSTSGNLPSWCPNYFQFDKIPPDRRLFEYVRDVIKRGRSFHGGHSHALSGRPLFAVAPGSAQSTEVIDEKILRTMAYRVGTIESLGWTASDESLPEFPEAAAPVAFQANGDEVARALWRLLLTLSQRDSFEAQLHGRLPLAMDTRSTEDYRTCTYAYTYFMLLVFGGNLEPEKAGSLEGWYAKWLCANQRFVYGQKTLQDHAKNTASVVWHWRFWKWAESFKDALQASAGHAGLRDWRRLHHPLRTLAREHMRLMAVLTGDKGVLGLAHSAAKLGDEIFLLPGCSVPVILRREPGARRYTVVGDAIIADGMFGEIWQRAHPNEIKNIEID